MPGQLNDEDYNRAIDKAINDAMDNGKFENLQGKGKPIDWSDENPFLDSAQWAANRILKSAGFGLPFMEERKEIEEMIISARASVIRSWNYYRDAEPGDDNTERWNKAVQTFRQRGAEINRMIRTFNIKVPHHNFHLIVLDIEGEISKVIKQ
jgi:DnaJ-like protein